MKRSRWLPFLAGGAALGVLALAGGARSATSPEHPFGSHVFIEAVKRLRPSVVHIRVKPRDAGGTLGFGFFGRGKKKEPGPFFDFEEGLAQQRFNVGSGIIVSADGYILTNHHVIKDGAELTVKLNDGEELRGRLIGVDEKTDLALLKVDPKKPLLPAALGDSDTVEVGEWVLAIGSPFGLAQSVTVGIISAKGRNLGEGPYDDYLQTDAVINPGNSGGPLGNSRGEVIGINTAIFSRGRRTWSMGIGFAIPVNQAKAVIDDLRHKGYPVRGRLGATIAEVPLEEGRRLGLGRNEGAKLAEVVRGGPADQGGLRRGDVVVEFNGTPVSTWESLPRMVARARPESEIQVKYYRDGKLHSARVRIGRSPEAPLSVKADPRTPLGMRVEPMTPQLAQRFGLENGMGLVVSAVQRDGPAAKGGILPGDEILEVNHAPVRTLPQYEEAVKRAESEGSVLLLLRRRGTHIFAALRLPG